MRTPCSRCHKVGRNMFFVGSESWCEECVIDGINSRELDVVRRADVDRG